MEEKEFRFSSKAEYEDELAKILKFTNVAEKSSDPLSNKRVKKFEKMYEDLIEEYLRFCSDDGK